MAGFAVARQVLADGAIADAAERLAQRSHHAVELRVVDTGGVDSPAAFEGTDRADGYPPYNIEKTGGDNYRVTLAVAGFGREELEITQTENTLVVKGGTADDGAGGKFLHRGIAGRAFERRFQLADHIRVVAAELENGLLHVDLEREVPEELKPRTIEIGGDAKRIAKAA